MTGLLLLPLLLAQTHSRWDASVHTEVRARTSTAQDQVVINNPDGGTSSAADLEVRGQLGGAVFNGPWTLSAGYTPRVFVREPYLKPHADQSQTLQVDGSWAREGSPRVFLDEYLNYGVLDVTTYGTATSAPMTGPAQPPGTLPLTQQLTTDTGFGVDWPLSRGVTLTTSVGYTFGGGLDAASQVGPGGAILPLQSSPRARARLLWQATRFDTLTFNAIWTLSSFKASDDCFAATFVRCTYAGAQVGIGELSANYARQLAPHTSVDITLGVTAAYGALPEGVNVPPPLPTGGLGVSHRIQRRAQRFDFRLSALLAPYVDRFRGTAYERVEGSGSATWGNDSGLFAYLRAGATQSLFTGPTNNLATLYAEGGVGYQGATWWRVDLTGREALQRSSVAIAAVPPSTQVTYRGDVQSQYLIGLSATFSAVSAPQTAATE